MRRSVLPRRVGPIMSFLLPLFLAGSVWAGDIKVGAVINLTGPASTWGQFHAKGNQDYLRYVNEVKGGVKGQKIDLKVVDHAYKVPEAVKYVKRFCTQDKMDLIATWDAGSGIMAKPITQQYKVPNINYSTYQGILKAPIDYAYLPFGAYDMDSFAVLEYIRGIHPEGAGPRVGLLTYNNTYGKSIHAPSKEAAARFGVTIAAIEEFSPKALDLTTEMLRLKNTGVDYIFMQCLPSAILMALQAADRVGVDVPFFGTWTSTDPDFFARGKGLIRDRMHMQFCGGLPEDDTPGVVFLKAQWERYKSVKKFDTAYWEGTIIGMIMERAFERAVGKFGKVTSATVNQALETFDKEHFGGLLPDVTYSPEDHSASWKARIVKINEDQTFKPLTAFWSPGREPLNLHP